MIRKQHDNTLTAPTPERVNARLWDYTRVRSWFTTEEPFTLTNGQLTGIGRNRRKAIHQRYSAASEVAAELKGSLGLPAEAFTNPRTHGTLDISHMDFYRGLTNRLEGESNRRFLSHAARRFYKLYGDIFRVLPMHPQDRSLAA